MSVPGKVLNRIILERMKGEEDKRLREEQAGFRQDRSCIDQIATLPIKAGPQEAVRPVRTWPYHFFFKKINSKLKHHCNTFIVQHDNFFSEIGKHLLGHRSGILASSRPMHNNRFLSTPVPVANRTLAYRSLEFGLRPHERKNRPTANRSRPIRRFRRVHTGTGMRMVY